MLFTSEHEQFRTVLRQLVEEEINPYADEWEAARIFPAHELFPKFGAVGALGLCYPGEFGGGDADQSYMAVFAEELGRADCGGVPMALAVQAFMATPALARFGSDALKQEFLAPAITGEHVCSVAVSEPGAGSDVAGIRTRARRDGDDWVISGRKMWITNGTQADWICLLARTSDEGGYQGMSLIVVPTASAGFSVGRRIEKMGNHSSDTAELVFDDVRVPVRNTIGEIGHGFQMQMNQFQDERLVMALMSVSGARRAIDRTKEYLRMREAFGQPLIANQYLQYTLAEFVAEVEILHGYLHHAIERYVEGQDVTRDATMAKLKAGRLVRQVADTCVQFHGGMGYAEEMWVARYLRDSRLGSIGAGADEVMLRVISMMEGMGQR
ncbi:MAG: acyl-CoA dehydrogenase family protein [Actinomycetales bacterium]|nr:acyl-CoA dehydrogenase family protein [Actinomycetales bacterium]